MTARLANGALLGVTVVVSFVLCEIAFRALPAAERLGWSNTAPVADRVAAAGDTTPGRARVVALGDSFTEWRDGAGDSYIRVAARTLAAAGKNIDVVNLAEAGTGIDRYYANLARHADRLRPELVVVGLYLGNDLRPAAPPLHTAEGRAAALAETPAAESDWRRLIKKSILLNTAYRLAKTRIAALQSGSLDALLAELQARESRDDAYVQARLALADPALVADARADKINAWDLATAVFFPDHYGALALAAPDTPKGREIVGALADLDVLIAFCRQRSIGIAVVLLPPPVWVAERHRDYFRRLGYGRLGPVDGPVPAVELVRRHLADKAVPVLDPLPLLRAAAEPAYLENDEHLNGRGHMVVGEALARLLAGLL